MPVQRLELFIDKTREIFAQLAQKIGQSWTFKVNSSFNWQNGNADAFNFGNTPGTIGVNARRA